MVELQEFSWLTWLMDPSNIFCAIAIGAVLLFALAAISIVWGRNLNARKAAIFAILLPTAIFAPFIWIDVNNTDEQVEKIEDEYGVSLMANKDGFLKDYESERHVKEFDKRDWAEMGYGTGDSYLKNYSVAVRDDNGNIREDAVLLLEREDLDDPFSASLAIPEEPEQEKTLVDYNTGEPISEKTNNAEEEETD